jgi:hypothetical protein
MKFVKYFHARNALIPHELAFSCGMLGLCATGGELGLNTGISGPRHFTIPIIALN